MGDSSELKPESCGSLVGVFRAQLNCSFERRREEPVFLAVWMNFSLPEGRSAAAGDGVER